MSREIEDQSSRYGKLKLMREGDELHLVSEDSYLITEILNQKKVQPYLLEQLGSRELKVDPAMRGHLKHTLIKLGFPVEDLAGYTPGSPFALSLRGTTAAGLSLQLRDYQEQAVTAFYAGGSKKGGSGVIRESWIRPNVKP